MRPPGRASPRRPTSCTPASKRRSARKESECRPTHRQPPGCHVECPIPRPLPFWRQRSGGLTMSRPDAPYHLPVLVEPLVAALAAVQPRVILDATFGGGGHSRALLAAIPGLRVIALDRDPDAAAEAQGLVRGALPRVGFQELEGVLKKEGLDELDGAVFDLGVSSHQFDVGERGFSYRSPGPLDMRMGPDARHDAAYFVNQGDQSALP